MKRGDCPCESRRFSTDGKGGKSSGLTSAARDQCCSNRRTCSRDTRKYLGVAQSGARGGLTLTGRAISSLKLSQHDSIYQATASAGEDLQRSKGISDAIKDDRTCSADPKFSPTLSLCTEPNDLRKLLPFLCESSRQTTVCLVPSATERGGRREASQRLDPSGRLPLPTTYSSCPLPAIVVSIRKTAANRARTTSQTHQRLAQNFREWRTGRIWGARWV